MDKKNFFRNTGKTIAIILFAATVLTGFNACVANDDNAVNPTPQPEEEVTEPYVEPTDDQLEVKVTYDMPTAVLGHYQMALVFLNGGYLALQRPTFETTLAFALGVNEQANAVVNSVLKDMGVEMSEEAATTRSLGSNKLVRQVNTARALTRGVDDDPV